MAGASTSAEVESIDEPTILQAADLSHGTLAPSASETSDADMEDAAGLNIPESTLVSIAPPLLSRVA